MLLNAQSSSFKIDGTVEDTIGNPLIASTVLLLEQSDSIMVDFTSTAMDGSFRFKDIEPGNYILKSTYIGFIPKTVNVNSQGDNVKVGTLKMTELAEELMEVVIKAAKASIVMRGDTVEYDASTFKVPEGSTVEDLLRRLPGIQIERDGAIQADGKDVDRVTVDGKSFFGADPKAATQNLPAEGISKVQVFDTKTEEEEITGATNDAQSKTMNLELKEDFKSGGFGRVIAGAGTEDRAELKGNFNRFNDKIQFSIVGVGNNTGRNGLSWDDYQDFLGSQSFSFSRGTEYGFGGGRNNFYYFGGGGGNALENSIQSVFFSGSDQGLPENYNGGVNFNYDNKKTQLSSVYYYNQAGLERNQLINHEKFYQDFVQNETSDRNSDDISRGHRAEVKIESELDSFHTIKIEFNGAHINENDISRGAIQLEEDDLLRSRSTYENNTNTSGDLANGLILLRKKFKKKGRSMGLNMSYLYTQLTDNWTQESTTNFFNSTEQSTSEEIINQINTNDADKKLFKANGLFVEPLGDKFFFQTFYNYSNRSESGDRDVSDFQDNDLNLNTELSRTYENKIAKNRVGSSLRYSHNGISATVGLAYQSFSLFGLSNDKSGLLTPLEVDKDFNNYIPHFSFNYRPNRNGYFGFSYNRNAAEPEIQSLQAIVDNTNPLFIRLGNPALTPEISNRISFNTSRTYPLSNIRFYVNGSYEFFDNRISSRENVDENFVTTYQPINLEGGNNTSLYANISFPLVVNKFTARVNFSGNRSSSPAIVNDIENTTTSNSLSPSLRLNITPSQDFTVYIDTRFSRSKTTYDINTSQDQITKTISYSAELSAKLLAGFYLNTNYDFTNYTNDRFNENFSIPILNSSIYRYFLPENKMEVRLSIYDALNRNVGFSQVATDLGLRRSETNALGRYVMLSLTYNIRGLKSSVKKNSWW
jgi:hypothetical protein